MKNKFLLLAAALVLSTTTFASNQAPLSNTNTVDVDATASKNQVTVEDVRDYMESFNIMACFIGEEPGTSNYLVKDYYGVWYRVYVSSELIGGYQQVDY